ncbi:MAG: glycosyltransferase [Pyrinomonadaceae bacterium]
MARTLYICYFGVRQPLVQTQVIPYLLELIRREDAETPGRGDLNISVSLLTFEPDLIGKLEADRLRAQLKSKGIEWHSLPYHKRFSAIATAYDIFRGAWFIRAQIRDKDIDVLHGRVHVPTLMGALARKFSKRKPKLLFDIRGFFPEEYTDAGVWPENGWLYRSAKRVERWLLVESDGFVVLTEKAREILFPESKTTGFDKRLRPVEVIPCCVDLDKFCAANDESRREIKAELNIGNRKVIAYVGSFGGWYLTDKILDFFTAALKNDPNTFILILTQRDKENVMTALLSRGFSEADFYVGSLAPDEIPRYLSTADVAVSFIKACYSKLSSSPTKIAEYLACGVQVISNRGVGDLDELIKENRVGVLLDNFTQDAYLAAIKEAEANGNIQDRCRIIAREEFDLEAVGGARYRRLYKNLLER